MPKRKRDRPMSHDATDESVPEPTNWNFGSRTAGGDVQEAEAPGARRRPTACMTCRRQKLKCEMAASGPPCTRCLRRGFSCVLNARNQALLDDQRQTDLLRRDVINLHEALTQVCQRFHIDPPQSLLSQPESRPPSTAQPRATTDATETENDDNDSNYEESPLIETPYTVHAPVDTFPGPKQGRRPSASTGDWSREGRAGRYQQQQQQQQQQKSRANDLIHMGLITLEEAEMLVRRYFSSLDPSLYGIASRYKSLDDIRQASPALLAAICTVSALHDPDDDRLYGICHGEFRRLFAASLFGEEGSIEYLRALCIASFWLLDDSRMLISDAVRRSADLRLHGYFHQVIKGTAGQVVGGEQNHAAVSQEDARDRIRLWYMIFVCDYHLSILDNRDGLLRRDKCVLENWDAYLASEGTSEIDSRIMSQAAILGILNDIRDTFGADQPPEPLHKSRVVQLNYFSQQLDDWWRRITAVYNADSRVGDFPRAGVDLHLQFGKLCLGHHIFRGLSSSSPIPQHFLPAATMARTAACSIFDMILHNDRLRASLVGRPHYVFIMISFAGHFLLEVCEKYAEQLPPPGIDVAETLESIGRALTLLDEVRVIARHPLRRMVRGLRHKVAAFTARAHNASSAQAYHNTNTNNNNTNIPEGRTGPAGLLGQTTAATTVTAPMRHDAYTVQGVQAEAASGTALLPDEMNFATMSAGLEQDLYADYDMLNNFPDIDMNFSFM